MKLSRAAVLPAVLSAALASHARTWEITSWNSYWNRTSSFTYAVNNASDGDILEIQNDVTVNSDIEIYKNITVQSAPGANYTITNRGRYYICNIHPGGKLTLSNIVVDCQNATRREDLFNLNAMEISGSVTNISRMVIGDGAVIRNVYLSSSSGNENAVIHVKEGAVLRINDGAVIENCDNQSEPGKGGAICCDYGTIIMTGGTIRGCNAKSAGGAIHTDGTRIDAVEVQGITARGDIYISGGYITNNTCAAGTHGGAIYLGNSGPMLHVTGNPVISNNFSGADSEAVPDDVSTYLLSDKYANRLKLTGHSDVNPTGFTTNGIRFTGWVGVRYPLEHDDPQTVRFGGQWEYFNGTQEEPRQFYWNGDNSYRGRLEANALVWSKHVTYELPLDGEKIADLIAGGEQSPLYIELDADYTMTKSVYVPENYEIILDLQGFELTSDFHVANNTGRVVIRDSSLMKSGKVTGVRKSDSPTAFVLEGGSYNAPPPQEWVSSNRVVIGNYCEKHPYMVAALAWESEATAKITDATGASLAAAPGQVRVVASAGDIADITYSAGDWVGMTYTNRNLRVQIYAAPAVSNAADGTVCETGARMLLFDSEKGVTGADGAAAAPEGTSNDSNDTTFGREDSFEWDAQASGLVKLIHLTLREQGESYVTNNESHTYFRFPETVLEATQRKTLSKLPIALSDALLASALGMNRADGFTGEEAGEKLDAVQANGLMKWENIVTGTADDRVILSTAEESDGGLALEIALSDENKSPAAGTGYAVFYDIRRSTGSGWSRIAGPSASPRFSIPLVGENGASAAASGLYRVTTLVVPESTPSVTNEIPSTNIVGVMEVSSVLTNTLSAVPWSALATNPLNAAESPVSVAKYAQTSHLTHDDAVKIADKGHIYRKWHWNKNEGRWDGAITVTSQMILAADEASQHTLGRDSAVWISRSDPESRPIILVGQYSASRATLTVAASTDGAEVCTLVPNPRLEATKVNDYEWGGKPLETDLIRIPNGRSEPHNLRWNGTEWGRIAPVPGGRGGAWKNDYTVPAGTGFWYMRTGGGEAFEIRLPQTDPGGDE